MPIVYQNECVEIWQDSESYRISLHSAFNDLAGARLLRQPEGMYKTLEKAKRQAQRWADKLVSRGFSDKEKQAITEMESQRNETYEALGGWKMIEGSACAWWAGRNVR